MAYTTPRFAAVQLELEQAFKEKWQPDFSDCHFRALERIPVDRKT
jgi:hypothetical protein